MTEDKFEGHQHLGDDCPWYECRWLKEKKDLTAQLERVTNELAEYKRGDVEKANRLLVDRCVDAERELRELKDRLEAPRVMAFMEIALWAERQSLNPKYSTLEADCFRWLAKKMPELAKMPLSMAAVRKNDLAMAAHWVELLVGEASAGTTSAYSKEKCREVIKLLDEASR